MLPADFLNLTDEQLALLAPGNPEAYGVLVARHRGFLLDFIFFRFIRERQAAEDVVQEALLKAYLNLSKFDPARMWKTWLYKIAVNCAYTALRKNRTENIEDYADVLTSGESPEFYTDQRIQTEKIDSALRAMAPECRKLLELHYHKNLSYAAIALILNLHPVIIKTRLRRAEQQLAVLFKDG